MTFASEFAEDESAQVTRMSESSPVRRSCTMVSEREPVRTDNLASSRMLSVSS
jgi:hypothetical protein